ncbi:MAG: putative metalloprotease CJM1_0395 family protein [Thermoguttaceae bacterium]
MTSFQPLITAAFSNYSAGRTAVADRAFHAARKEKETPLDKILSEAIREGIKTPPIDLDAGKPKSASGDVLDLSVFSLEQKSTEQKSTEQKIDQTKSDSAKSEATKSDAAKLDGSITPRSSERTEKAPESASAKSADTKNAAENKDDASNAISVDESSASTRSSDSLSSETSAELTPEEQEQIDSLKSRDTEVRTHEAAHVSAGGAFVTGGPSYTYQTGPDGKKYAIGGEVGIDTSPISGNPEATIQKMRTVASAAMAPASPSGQDYKVAAAARQQESQAQRELAQQKQDAVLGTDTSKDGSTQNDAPEEASSMQTDSSAASSNKSTSNKSSSSKSSSDGAKTESASVSSSNSAIDSAIAASATLSTSSISASYQAQSNMSAQSLTNTVQMTSGQSDAVRFSAFA